MRTINYAFLLIGKFEITKLFSQLKSVFLKNVLDTRGWSKNLEKLPLLISRAIFANFWINPFCQVRSLKKTDFKSLHCTTGWGHKTVTTLLQSCVVERVTVLCPTLYTQKLFIKSPDAHVMLRAIIVGIYIIHILHRITKLRMWDCYFLKTGQKKVFFFLWMDWFIPNLNF